MAAVKVLAFIKVHNVDWARTGHAAGRNLVIKSDEYTGTAAIARDTTPSAAKADCSASIA